MTEPTQIAEYVAKLEAALRAIAYYPYPAENGSFSQQDIARAALAESETARCVVCGRDWGWRFYDADRCCPERHSDGTGCAE